MTIPGRSSDRRPTLILLFSCLIASTSVLVGLAGPAAAEIEVDAPDEVAVGTETEVTAVVTEDGVPLADVEVVLSFVGTIGGKSGWVEVDSALTDESGTVSLRYEQRALSAERMRVEYVDLEGKAQSAAFEVLVIDGTQQHTSKAGAALAIFGVWWLLIVIGFVWVMVLVAVYWIVKIGRSSDLDHGPVLALPRFIFGLVAFTAVGMFVVILSRPTTHANLDPTADFERRSPALVGSGYDYIGLSSEADVVNRANNLDEDTLGEALYVTANCVGCHGVGALGAVVARALVDVDDHKVINLSSFIEDVREGPKDMPAYSETRLTDPEITLIHEYLFGS